MLELSIASSLYDLSRRHVPDGNVLLSVKVRVGPMRGIEPEAMQAAWRACALGSSSEKATLDLEMLPWRLHCPHCDRHFKAQELRTTCRCGAAMAHPVGGDELMLVSIEIDDEPTYRVLSYEIWRETTHESRNR